MAWIALMKSVNMTGKNQQQIMQASGGHMVMAGAAVAPCLAVYSLPLPRAASAPFLTAKTHVVSCICHLPGWWLQAIVAVIKKYHKLLSTFATSGKLELGLLVTVQVCCVVDCLLICHSLDSCP